MAIKSSTPQSVSMMTGSVRVAARSRGSIGFRFEGLVPRQERLAGGPAADQGVRPTLGFPDLE